MDINGHIQPWHRASTVARHTTKRAIRSANTKQPPPSPSGLPCTPRGETHLISSTFSATSMHMDERKRCHHESRYVARRQPPQKRKKRKRKKKKSRPASAVTKEKGAKQPPAQKSCKIKRSAGSIQVVMGAGGEEKNVII